ncbi:MAG: hypothetical protein H8D24_06680 [Gammaproteobacteria bacterium]|uniref:Uncharacterized protein n=1 Tax=Candidatus Thiopontia autotrophica TaxID=2841688 RepID=A0A8J6PBM9_9GAMM|nr:hypothetical protein [Candidatus Thiopontia autotrophica]MBL6968900.1 hypothetical protein [Gammaproteobacteria bacterium]
MNQARSTYRQTFNGSFSSLLQWDDLTTFWQRLLEEELSGWYIYAVGEKPPATTSSPDDLRHFITKIDALLRKDHNERVCGIVYTDHPHTPSMIKIYDPNNLGVSCGSSETPPLPGWVLSKEQPEDLQPVRHLPGNRKRWWRDLFS